MLEQQAQQLGITEHVVWRSAVTHEQVPKELSAFDVLVLPSRSIDTWKEQFGHVLIEAMAIGIPTVGSTCGEIPNVIGHHDLFFEEEDAAGLAAILARLIRDEDFRREMSQYCLQRAQQQYTHERIAQRLVALWQRILKSCSGTSPLASSPVSTPIATPISTSPSTTSEP